MFLILSSSAFAEEKVGWDRVNSRDLCAKSNAEIAQALQLPAKASQSCIDQLYSAVLYGREWVMFKSGYAFAIVHHENYQGPCWNLPIYDGVHYSDICK